MSSRVLSRSSAAIRHPYLSAATLLAVIGLLVTGVLVATRPVGALPGNRTQDSALAKWQTPPNATCRAVKVPVSLIGLGLLKVSTIAGELCLPSGAKPSTVQVLLAGATYDRYYWNPPDQPQNYSYVWAATSAGYATRWAPAPAAIRSARSSPSRRLRARCTRLCRRPVTARWERPSPG